MKQSTSKRKRMQKNRCARNMKAAYLKLQLKKTTLSQLISLDTSMLQGRRPEGRYWSMVEFGMVFVFDMYCCF